MAIISATILIIGLLLKPHDKLRPSPQDARVDAVRADLNSLRELAQRNTLRNTSNRFSEMASADAAYLLETDGGKTAVVWSDAGLLISASQRLPALPVVSDGKQSIATPSIWGAGLPFTLYQAKHLSESADSTAKLEDLEPGTWIVVDTLGPQGPEFVSGMYSGTGKTTCEGVDYDKVLLSAPFDSRFLGAGMFDIDGDLIAILAQCDREVAAIPVEEIVAHIADLRRPEQTPFAHLGFLVKPIAAPLDGLLPGASGMVVTDVWANWPAGIAGLAPGDVLLAVNNAPAVSVQQVADALRSMPVQLRVQKTPHVIVNITLEAQPAAPEFELGSQADGVVIANVSTAIESRLGLRAGDSIMSVGGHPATEKSVSQLLSSRANTPSLITVQRGTRQFLVVVPR